MNEAVITDNYMLEKLLIACDHFAPSLPQSTMLYNYSLLMAFLQDKEIAVFKELKGSTEDVYKLTRRFGPIASGIVRKTMADPMGEYMRLEKEVEENLSGNIYLYAKQWALSVKALYYYKLKNYQKAFDFTLECIALNEHLIREGVHTLLFRSAEQNRNLIRVFFRSGDWDAGATLGRDLIDYLFNNTAGTLYGKIFSEEAYWNKVPYVRECYACQCFNGLVSHMIHLERLPNPEIPSLFPYLFENFTVDPSTPDRLIIYNWLDIKTAFHKGMYDLFLEEFIEFMTEPVSQLYDILKISLFLDVSKLIENSNYDKKAILSLKIKDYLETKLNVYETLRKDISASNFVVNDFN